MSKSKKAPVEPPTEKVDEASEPSPTAPLTACGFCGDSHHFPYGAPADVGIFEVPPGNGRSTGRMMEYPHAVAYLLRHDLTSLEQTVGIELPDSVGDPIDSALNTLDDVAALGVKAPRYTEGVQSALSDLDKAISALNADEDLTDNSALRQVLSGPRTVWQGFLNLDLSRLPEVADLNTPTEVVVASAPVPESETPKKETMFTDNPVAPRQSAGKRYLAEMAAQLNVTVETLCAAVAKTDLALSVSPPNALKADGWNPVKQWRNPKNGRWIDMPDVALDKLTDILFDLGGPDQIDGYRDLEASIQKATDAMNGEGSNRFPNIPWAKDILREETLPILRNVEREARDLGAPPEVLEGLQNTRNSIETYEVSYVASESTDITGPQDSDLPSLRELLDRDMRGVGIGTDAEGNPAPAGVDLTPRATQSGRASLEDLSFSELMDLAQAEGIDTRGLTFEELLRALGGRQASGAPVYPTLSTEDVEVLRAEATRLRAQGMASRVNSLRERINSAS